MCDLIWREEGRRGKFVKNLYDWWVKNNLQINRPIYLNTQRRGILIYKDTVVHISECTGRCNAPCVSIYKHRWVNQAHCSKLKIGLPPGSKPKKVAIPERKIKPGNVVSHKKFL